MLPIFGVFVEKSRNPNGTSLSWIGLNEMSCVSPDSESYTHPYPSKGELVSDFLGFLKEYRELLVAQLICTKETSEVTNGSLENAMKGEC